MKERFTNEWDLQKMHNSVQNNDGSHLNPQELRPAVEACSDVRVVRTVHFLMDSQRVPVQSLCLLILALECHGYG